MSDEAERTSAEVAAKAAWIKPTMEVIASTGDIAGGALSPDEDFTGTPPTS